MDLLIGISIFIILIVVEYCYILLARKYKIFAYPGGRSAHAIPVPTGGGIIFYIAYILFVNISLYMLTNHLISNELFSNFYPLALCGITLITLISFKDDISAQSPLLRIIIHFIGIGIICLQINTIIFLEWYYWLIILICGTGFINAYNFMDGIAGITGLYSMVVLASTLYINDLDPVINPNLIITILISAIVFCIYNFRKEELCFAGDTGAMTMGAIIFFIMTVIILETKNPCYLILVAVYGTDTILTIIRRIMRRENIFLPHQRHLYQNLVLYGKLPHLATASIYAGVQAIVSFGFIITPRNFHGLYFILAIAMLSIIYCILIYRYKKHYL